MSHSGQDPVLAYRCLHGAVRASPAYPGWALRAGPPPAPCWPVAVTVPLLTKGLSKRVRALLMACGVWLWICDDLRSFAGGS